MSRNDWIDDVLDAATNPVGTHQIVTLAQGHKIEAGRTYESARTAFGQQSRILTQRSDLNVYVASHYPNGRVLWTGKNCLIRDRTR